MRFEFANRVAGALFEPLFEDTAASLVDAFVKRARAKPRLASAMKRCTVVFATPERQWRWRVELPDDGDGRGRAGGSRARRRRLVEVPWDADVGIFGELCDARCAAARRRPDRDLPAAQVGPEGVPAGAGARLRKAARDPALSAPAPKPE